MSALEYTLTRSFPLRIFSNLMQSEMTRHTINRGIPPTALAKSHTSNSTKPPAYQYR